MRDLDIENGIVVDANWHDEHGYCGRYTQHEDFWRAKEFSPDRYVDLLGVWRYE